MSTQWAYTQNVRETWVGDCLVGPEPPQVPQVSYLTATLGNPALGELPRLSRQGDRCACPASGPSPGWRERHPEYGGNPRAKYRAEAVQKGGLAGGYEVPVLRVDRGLGKSCV